MIQTEVIFLDLSIFRFFRISFPKAAVINDISQVVNILISTHIDDTVA